jgi:hypothetical protein
MAERKREDPATFGDLQDLAEQTRSGFADALKDALGKVIPGPAPKDDGGSGGDGGGSGGDGGNGDGGDPSPAKSDFGFGGKWWGNK